MVNIYFCYMKDWSLHGFSRKENCTLSIQTNKGLERKGHLHKGAHLKTHVCKVFLLSYPTIRIIIIFYLRSFAWLHHSLQAKNKGGMQFIAG